MKASLVHIRDPFRPQVGRSVHRLSRRTRVDTLLRQHGLIAGRGRRARRLSHFVVSLGPDQYLLQDQWSRQVADGEVLTIIAVPAGGNALRTLAMIAVSAAAIWAAPLVAAWIGVSGTAWTSAIAAGLSMVGSVLVNKLLPPPKAPLGSNSGSSSNYGIGASGNQARLSEPIPVLYGRFRVVPNYAAQPYTEYDGANQQTLFSLLAITQGSLAIEQIRIGDTPIDNFAEVKYEVIEPGGVVTLFPDNVVTSDAVAGIELKAPSDGGNWSGPFVANPAGTQTNQIAIDIGYPQGLYRLNKDGKERTANSPWIAQAQRIDDQGNALSDWQTLEQANDWLDDKTSGLYRTRRYDVAAGRYQVRIRKLQPADQDGSIINTLYWMGLRAYLPSQRVYGDVTLLAVRIRATNQLNSSTAKAIEVIGTRKLPVWNGAAWTAPVATRSIAWAAADVLRNATYGRGWPDNRIDLASLAALDATWAARGDTFDGVFDTKTTVWDALTSVARCGRALPMYYAGVVTLVRDQPQTVPTLALSPHNIVQGSFQLQYAFPTQDTADYVVVTYTDADTWKDLTVECALTGSAKRNPKQITLMGCTQRAHAFREGMYMAACNRDQRKTVSLSTEMEGLIPRYGDLVSVSHDVPAWGLSGEVAAYDAPSGTLTLTEPTQWWPGQNHYVLLRQPNGSAAGPFRVAQGADPFHVVLQGLTPQQLASLAISDGIRSVPTIYQFGPGEQYAQMCLITSAKPSANGQVQLTLANYAPSVYLAETDSAVPPPPSGSLLTNPPTGPTVGGVGVNQDPGTQTVRLFVDPVAGAVAYEFQVSYDGGVTWISVGIATANSIEARIPAGHWIVRARAISTMGVSGGWTQNPIDVSGDPPALGALSNLLTSAGVFQILIAWQLPTRLQSISADATEIWFNTTNNRGTAQLLATVPLPGNSYTLNNLPAGASYFFWARLRGTDAGNYGPEVGPVAGASSTDASSILGYLTGQITETQLAQDLLEPIKEMTPDMAGEADQFAGDNTRFAGVWTQLSASQAADMAQASRVDTVQATVNDTSAVVQQTAATVVDLNGRVSASWTVRCQVTADGRIYGAGMGLGVQQQADGTYQSQALFQVDRFALINVANGAATVPFVVQGGQTFISQALIGDGWINNAMIGNVIQSSVTGAGGAPRWKLDKNGSLTMTGPAGAGYLTINDSLIQVFDSAGTLRVRLGTWS